MEHLFKVATAGSALSDATKALIMLHGRGSSAEDILSLSTHLKVEDFALLAPKATNNTWYPQSFIAPVGQNEPWLSSAISTVGKTVSMALEAGISEQNIYFFGFSQGACLTLEYLARNAKQYGGAAAIIGGLIGQEVNLSNYKGDFKKTPIFIGTSNPDFHVPIERVYLSEGILSKMNAEVKLKEYPNFGHTIHPDQINQINKWILA